MDSLREESSDRPNRQVNAGQVLVVEDDEFLRTLLARQLTERGCRVHTAATADEALEILGETPIDVTVSDVRMPTMTGLELLGEVRKRDSEAELILITANSSVTDAVAAIHAGAADYLEKPVDCRRLFHSIQMMVERRRLRQRVRLLEVGGKDSTLFEGMAARSPRMREVFQFIERVAAYPTTVLVTGESGTGKELAARAVHRRSPVRDEPFVVCNCSALSPSLIESELFGHVKGAFTGADRDHKGLFEAANGGTIFLDEIGELPLESQVKLLRVLENREIRRVGAQQTIPVEIRVVAATNRDLASMSREGTFREDLYYRLNVGVIRLPALRERSEDVALLADHFLQAFERKFARERLSLAPSALEALLAYPWPGNVRELANILERSCIMASDGLVRREHLPPEVRDWTPGRPRGDAPCEGMDPGATKSVVAPVDLTLGAAERDQILRALDSAGGKRAAAARLLGLSRRTLYRKLEKYGIQR